MVHKEFERQPLEEVLEEIWCGRELKDDSVSGLKGRSKEPDIEGILNRLVEENYVGIDGDTVMLKQRGEERARKVVRRHRLAERLLIDLFDVDPEEGERTACLMEHVLSPTVTDAVCTMLGHPPTCPHGHEIPRGACCTAKHGRIDPVIRRLPDMSPGSRARITLIAPTVEKRMERLGSFGLVPGTSVTLKQKHPALVVDLDGTSLALDREIADEIYVRGEDD